MRVAGDSALLFKNLLIHACPYRDRLGVIVIAAKPLRFAEQFVELSFRRRELGHIIHAALKACHLCGDDLTRGHRGDQRVEVSQLCLITERQVSHFDKPIAEECVIVEFVLVEHVIR